MTYYPNSIDWKPIQEGGLRRLRLGEINLANSLFGFSILYHQVWVHLESYLPFDSQNPGQAMTPNGEMWFREGANKQVISSQADSLIKISRIWADFFPANTSNQPI